MIGTFESGTMIGRIFCKLCGNFF